MSAQDDTPEVGEYTFTLFYGIPQDVDERQVTKAQLEASIKRLIKKMLSIATNSGVTEWNPSDVSQTLYVYSEQNLQTGQTELLGFRRPNGMLPEILASCRVTGLRRYKGCVYAHTQDGNGDSVRIPGLYTPYSDPTIPLERVCSFTEAVLRTFRSENPPDTMTVCPQEFSDT